MFSIQNCILFTTVLFSGLVAGLLYGYACSVNIGLKELPAEGYLKAMQSINTAIQNPYFFVSFMGLLIMFPLSLWRLYTPQPIMTFYLFLIAALLYFIGVFGITMIGNIPLNNLLDKFVTATSSPDEIVKMRLTFEIGWNRFHLIRTISSILSFGFTIVAIMKYKT
jgi:uncharacterized membrane protein